MTSGRDGGGRVVTGAEALLAAAAQRRVTVCFANPGTTELAVVAALGSSPEIRAILGVHENVCTGAADGYARMTGQPALTLLHLGPGLANGLANLHNARRARSPVVNVVGDHTSWHLPFDAPLTSDIAALARTVGAHHEVRDRSVVTQATWAAIDDAADRRGVSTLVVPADFLEEPAPEVPAAAPLQPARPGADGDRIEQTARRLRDAGSRAVLLLGGAALTRRGQRAAGDIAAATGAALYSETFPARAERGGGLPVIDRLPYFPEAAKARLADADALVLTGAAEPVTYFGYRGIPSRLAPEGSVHVLAGRGEDAEQALLALAENLGRSSTRPRPAPAAAPDGSGAALSSEAALTGQSAGSAVASWLPEHAIVSIEGGTCGYPFYAASARAAPHTVLTNTGGAIGQGLPAALGAAIACPDRPVIALQSDGSALYTAQALWTMARESVNVTVLIAANNTYNVLRTELARSWEATGGDAGLSAQAARLTSLGDPAIDWESLARGYGVAAATVATIGELHRAFTDSVKAGGPHLIQLAMAQS